MAHADWLIAQTLKDTVAPMLPAACCDSEKDMLPAPHVAHLAAPLSGQSVPVAPVPFAQVHCLSSPHTASAVLDAAVVSTLPNASQSTVCAEHAVWCAGVTIPTL